MTGNESNRTCCLRIVSQLGYRVTAAGDVIAPSGRHLGTRLVSRNGYAHFSFTVHKTDRTKYGLPRVIRLPVHRLASYQLFGEKALEPGIEARHLNGNCLDNRLVNIAIGTRSDNMMDRPEHVRKAIAGYAGSHPRPSRRKCSDDQVRELRQRFKAGETALALAREFELAKGSVNNIVYGRSYKDVK